MNSKLNRTERVRSCLSTHDILRRIAQLGTFLHRLFSFRVRGRLRIEPHVFLVDQVCVDKVKGRIQRNSMRLRPETGLRVFGRTPCNTRCCATAACLPRSWRCRGGGRRMCLHPHYLIASKNAWAVAPGTGGRRVAESREPLLAGFKVFRSACPRRLPSAVRCLRYSTENPARRRIRRSLF